MSPLELFDTLTAEKRLFAPLDAEEAARENRPVRVKMYVCGPTVYDDAHLGHARCYITWDVLYRFLKFLDYEVTYVRNVTDVDDKILNRARELGQSPAEVAERNYESFKADMQALNVLSPDVEPRATQYIDEMLQGIEALIEKGAAYITPDGSVYYRVSAKADYGKLKYHTQNPAALQKHLADLQAGARVEVGEVKESPLDFALWKAVPLDDANGWQSPWPAQGQHKGWGRPGWHMECSAMNHAVFGDQIDIHAGGADLIFPHHENEIAQSEAWTGKTPFARYWMHNGFVNVSGEKMSKSLGNFSTVKKLLARYDANTIRYFLLTNHYRMPVDFNDEALQAAENWAVSRHKKLKDACEKMGLSTQAQCLTWLKQNENQEQEPLQRFKALMSDDLNTAKALVLLNELIGLLDVSKGSDWQPDEETLAGHLLSALSVFTHLGFGLEPLFQKAELPHAEVSAIYQDVMKRKPDSQAPEAMLQAIIQYRMEAKKNKDWATADKIRDALKAAGIQIMDNKDGTTTWDLVRP